MSIISKRKEDHIELSDKSQTSFLEIDDRFDYEPLFFNEDKNYLNCDFLGKKMSAPIWISSMTGGGDQAKKINQNLAKVCSEFGLGMGLGSCRALLEDDRSFDDFNIRHIIGDASPMLANLGIAQVQSIIKNGESSKIGSLIGRLKADGIIIHINPLQEFAQPEGDILEFSPIETIIELKKLLKYPIFVKEVGQGIGPQSLKMLVDAKIDGLEFGAFGGTNFTKLELFRNRSSGLDPLIKIGHSAAEMVGNLNDIFSKMPVDAARPNVIISGGVQSFLDGHYLMKKANFNSIYGQANSLLEYANSSYADLRKYISSQIKGLEFASRYLHLKKDKTCK